jgi:hypothetical protein
MPIPSHQIRNVLSSYAKSLARKNGGLRKSNDDSRRSSEKFLSDAEGKRRMVIEKVVCEIVDKITALEVRAKDPRPPRPESAEESGGNRLEGRLDDSVLTYYRMEEDGKKRKASYLPEK